MPQTFPGADEKGYRDPTGLKLMVFADTTARDAWVTLVGSANISAGTMCFLTGTNAINIWNGSAWRSVATA